MVIMAISLVFKKIFYYRAWEFFDAFVYTGEAGLSQHFDERGDSSRQYFYDKFYLSNQVTINALGNRIGCYEEHFSSAAKVLLLGDSQLFGSGTDDEGTFSAHLCKKYRAAVYNAARRNGIRMLKHPHYEFTSILYTVTERDAGSCHWLQSPDKNLFIKEKDNSSFLIAQTSATDIVNKAHRRIEFLRGFFGAKFDNLLSGRIIAPANRLDLMSRVAAPIGSISKLVECAREVKDVLHKRNIKVGFLVFPANRSIYPLEYGLTTDDVSLGFIDRLSEAFEHAGLATFNTRECLLRAAAAGDVSQRHDTHLNSLGYKSLTDCIDKTSLSGLFR